MGADHREAKLDLIRKHMPPHSFVHELSPSLQKMHKLFPA